MADTADEISTRAHLPSSFDLGVDGSDIPTRTLVFGLTDRHGAIGLGDLLSVAQACNLSEDQVRSCLRRLVAEGLYERRGEGREATYHTTDAGDLVQRAVLSRHLLAYAQDAAGRGWDRRWHLVGFAVPERRRAARDGLRDHLRTLGGALIHPGLYVSPHPWEDQVAEGAAQLGVAEHLTMASTDDLSAWGITDPRKLAAELWPLDELARRYEEFIADYRDVPQWLEAQLADHHRLPEADWLPGVLAFAHRFSRTRLSILPRYGQLLRRTRSVRWDVMAVG